ncbi:hypothetical protein [Lonsdalea quercina]
MKFSLLLLMLCALTGCVRHNGGLPPVSGESQPVNSQTTIQELINHARD